MKVREGKIISLDKMTSSGTIQDENYQDINFDISEYIEGLYPGARVTFEIALTHLGLTAIHLCILV